MAFTQEELPAIEALMRQLCLDLATAHAARGLGFGFEVERLSVIIIAARPDPPPAVTFRHWRVAKFRYYRSRGGWELYWMDVPDRWEYFDGPFKRLSTLARRVLDDTEGYFVG